MLDLYWSPLAPGGGGYVCADHETALAAYSSLHVNWVPCRILGPKKVVASEASIWLEKHGDRARLKKTVAPVTNSYRSFVGCDFPPLRDVISALINECEITQSSIIAFHKDDGSNVHYYQMLHALLRRHERVLDLSSV